MIPVGRKTIILIVVLIGAAGLGWVLFRQLPDSTGPGGRGKGTRSAPVEVAPIQRGPIELKRTFSGTLEPRAEFVVAPKVSGRVERLAVNLADTVKRGQVVAELDNDEYVQAVAQA
ncbi:MAG: biotin/lipoyl-binding protein, partial [Deltaproteobacteria bacterium]|nr:biotin/lipoyl-binding protein [Deltaproteobacteria bacterium]